jgi:hypothetical protein
MLNNGGGLYMLNTNNNCDSKTINQTKSFRTICKRFFAEFLIKWNYKTSWDNQVNDI